MPDFHGIILLLDLKLAELFSVVRSLPLKKLVGVLVSFVIAVAISALVYRLDLFIFAYLLGMPDLGKLVIARFFELAFLLFFVVLVVSTALTSLSMLYRDDELSLLFSLPVSQGAVFTAKFFEVIVYSTWALVALMVPFILSYGVYFKVDWPAYFTLFGGLMFPLVLISGSIGVAAALMLRWLFGGISRRKLFKWGAVILGLLVITVLIMTLAKEKVGQRGIAYLFSLLEIKKSQDASLLPHKLISRGLLSILEGRYDLLQRVVLTLLSMCALVVLLTLDMGKAIYYRSWLKGIDRSPTVGRSSEFFKPSFWSQARWISPIYRALFRKDLLEFRRYPLQWGQAFLLVGIWALYLINIANIGRFFDVDQSSWKMLLFFANFCFACYFAAALAGRFVFPLISLEGQAFWLLRSAPLAMDSFLWSKFWQAFIPLLIMVGSMIVVGDIALKVDRGLFQVSLLCAIVATFSLTAISLGMGAVYANFSQRNPMKIANTPGGILCIFLSLVLTVLMTSIFGWPTYLHYKYTTFAIIFPMDAWVTAVIIFLAIGILATLWPLKMALNALNRDLKS
ncbi:MAG: hypothetical protein NTW14_04255 [bacterium]|nr:hypothetical protein [bacterium]